MLGEDIIANGTNVYLFNFARKKGAAFYNPSRTKIPEDSPYLKATNIDKDKEYEYIDHPTSYLFNFYDLKTDR